LTFRAILLKSINMHLFGTSGIRRLVNQELIELSLRVGLSVGTIYNNVVVGRDTRTSGKTIYHAILAGLLASGAHTSDAGILPTPTLAYATREFKAGIMITASHNPPQYNGLKLLNPDGSAFSIEQQQQIEDYINGVRSINLSWNKMQNTEEYYQAVEKHISGIVQDFPHNLGLKVVVDAGCGAAYFITPQLLTRMGCDVIPLNCYPNGIFPHDVEPIEDNMSELKSKVKEIGADFGIAHDGDADRMMAVDELGRFISGDKLLAIFAKASNTTRIVTTMDASMSIEGMGFEIKRTKVGDPYVSEELKRGGIFGGEPSGAWVFPRISLCPDGIYAVAQIASIAKQHKLSKLVDSIPEYPTIRGSVIGSVVDMAKLKQRLMAELKPISTDTLDGIKLLFRDSWLLIRPSGTEPKIRLTAEAQDESSAQRLYEYGARIIKEYQKG
jgi:phosphoglucosamine mutase